MLKIYYGEEFFALGNVHTGVNFIDKVECCAMIRFVRITYVRPLDQSMTCRTMYSPPVGLSYKTFVPAAVKVGMCSGSPQYESFTATWERSKAWLKCVGWCHLLIVDKIVNLSNERYVIIYGEKIRR